MMRRSLAASIAVPIAVWLGACLIFGALALAPDDASAWLINQPRFEKQVVTEGDPDDPDLTYPDSPTPSSVSEGSGGTDGYADITSIVVAILEVIGI